MQREKETAPGKEEEAVLHVTEGRDTRRERKSRMDPS